MNRCLIFLVVVGSLLLNGCQDALTESDLPTQTEIYPVDTLCSIPDSAIGYLSIYASSDELIASGDDDEAAAWLWFHTTYPQAKYIYFGDIQQEQDIAAFKVLFWIRDVETGDVNDVLRMPSVMNGAQGALQLWFQHGGNLLLWGHAVLMTEYVGRLPEGTYSAPSHEWVCGCDTGRLDNATWVMATQLNLDGTCKKDNSTHPLFDGIAIYTNNDMRGICVKGPGWTEDHNCVFFNYPSELTGRQWQKEICYNLLTSYYGIIPLGVWDSQTNWVSQLNVYELRKGNTNNLGTIICVGNGGCEFSMKGYRQVGVNTSGAPLWGTTDDRSAYPTNNCYQGNILQMAKNGIEYLRRL